MSTDVSEMTELESFHSFVARQLAAQPRSKMSVREALAAWREEQATLAAIKEGLADIAAGRVKSLEEFDRDIRQRYGFEKAT